MAGGWIDDFTTGWSDPGPAPTPTPPPAPAAPTNRRPVMAICCPRCQSLDVRATRHTEVGSYWSCKACSHGWREPPGVVFVKASILPG